MNNAREMILEFVHEDAYAIVQLWWAAEAKGMSKTDVSNQIETLHQNGLITALKQGPDNSWYTVPFPSAEEIVAQMNDGNATREKLIWLEAVG